MIPDLVIIDRVGTEYVVKVRYNGKSYKLFVVFEDGLFHIVKSVPKKVPSKLKEWVVEELAYEV